MLSDAARPLFPCAIAAGAVAFAAFAFPARSDECPPTPSEVRAVTGIDKSLRLTLDDGSSLRLMSLLMPSSRDLPTPAPNWAPEAQARSAIKAMVDQKSIRVAMKGAYRDRYNRRVAHALASGSGESGFWLQSALVDGGFARVSPLPGETLCLQDLFAREAVARAKRAGLWSSPAYGVRSAQDIRTLETLTGTFQIVEGWIAAVGSSRTEVFINFGRNWKWDFTASVNLKRDGDREAVMARLKDMKGRLVRVRGFIEKRNGPFVSLASVDAIEVIPEGSAGGR